jgi:hypothetical protein
MWLVNCNHDDYEEEQDEDEAQQQPTRNAEELVVLT